LTSKYSAVGFIALLVLAGPASVAIAQSASPYMPSWVPKAIDHAEAMRRFRDIWPKNNQATPFIIPKYRVDRVPGGFLGHYQPNGATFTFQNAFFRPLGTNGRTCLSCHQPQEGWTISAAGVQARFEKSSGMDPIFRLVDGATCPTANVSTLQTKRVAYALLLTKGLLRIAQPLPPEPSLKFKVINIDDPYQCSTNSATGLTSPTDGILSVYRRPLPSTNLRFLNTFMWDGREPSLESQAIHATRIHAQATADPDPTQIVAFEKGIYSAQVFDSKALQLDAKNARGGPIALSVEPGTGSNGFDIFTPWAGLPGRDSPTKQRQSIARGEDLFNQSCAGCHDVHNAGNRSAVRFFDLGLAKAGADSPPAVDISGLPVFTLECTQGDLIGTTFTVTDPGRALITGECSDIGKFKAPTLRALAARAPYFHNGSAPTLEVVVEFYNVSRSLGLSDTEKDDMVNFLKVL
jgi:cytochrome c peroxidase